MNTPEIKHLDESQLAYYPFTKKEVLKSKPEIFIRRFDLERAQQLGNLYRHSVSIHFKNTKDETVIVNGSVWALTEDFVQLKGSMSIPIRSIERVIV